jgi:hypothetical protein
VWVVGRPSDYAGYSATYGALASIESATFGVLVGHSLERPSYGVGVLFLSERPL